MMEVQSIEHIKHGQDNLGGGFKYSIFYFHPYLGKIPILTNTFFNWVETTNYQFIQPDPTIFPLGLADRIEKQKIRQQLKPPTFPEVEVGYFGRPVETYALEDPKTMEMNGYFQKDHWF